MSKQNEYMQTAEMLIGAIRHCTVLGFQVIDAGKGALTLEMPYQDSIVGNPDTRTIHGGALTTLMDTACGLCVPMSFDTFQICPTLDLRIDYMTAAKPDQSIFGRAEVYRTTDNIVFAKGVAYQGDGDQETIIAHCVATFMRLPKETVERGKAQP